MKTLRGFPSSHWVSKVSSIRSSRLKLTSSQSPTFLMDSHVNLVHQQNQSPLKIGSEYAYFLLPALPYCSSHLTCKEIQKRESRRGEEKEKALVGLPASIFSSHSNQNEPPSYTQITFPAVQSPQLVLHFNQSES